MDHLLTLSPWHFFFDLKTIQDTLPTLLFEGFKTTILVTLGSYFIGVFVGLWIAVAAISDHKLLRWPAKLYIDIFRGLPAVVTISLIGLGIPIALMNYGGSPWGRNTIVAAIIGLGLVSTAYTAEVYRGGIQSIDVGQTEAARSLGMSARQALWLIVIPQAIRRIIPPLTNEFIALTKDSSLIFVLGLSVGGRDLYRVGTEMAQQTGNYSAVVAAGLCYLIITIPVTRFSNYLEYRLNKNGSRN